MSITATRPTLDASVFAALTPPIVPIDDRPDDLAKAFKEATSRFVRSHLRQAFTGRRADIRPIGQRSETLQGTIDKLKEASDQLAAAVDQLADEVSATEWGRYRGNDVLVAVNLCRGREEWAPPAVATPSQSREVLCKEVRRASDRLEDLFSAHWLELAEARGTDARYVNSFLKTETDRRHREAVVMVRSDMTISAGSPDGDGRQSQGEARSVLLHRWRTDDGTRWKGAHHLTSYCDAVVLEVAAQQLGTQADAYAELAEPADYFAAKADGALHMLRLSRGVEPDVDAGAEPFYVPEKILGAPKYTFQPNRDIIGGEANVWGTKQYPLGLECGIGRNNSVGLA